MQLLRAPPCRGILAPMAAAWGVRRATPSGLAARGAATPPRWRAASVAATQAGGAAPAAPAAAAQQRAPPARGGRQTLDYTALLACLEELRAQWVPSKVEEVVQPDAYTLSLRLRTPQRQGWLHLSWHPAAARVCAGGPPPRGAASEAFSFAAAADQQLRGLVLTGVAAPAAWERVAALQFGPRPGDPPARLAYCELMAKYSNVVLTDGAGTVLAAAHQVGGRMSSLRQVQQGRAYALPPIAAGVPPALGEPPAEWRRNRAAAAPPRPSVLGGCVRAYQGVSPSLAEELCATAGVPPGAHPGDLRDPQWDALHGAWRGWLERVEGGRYAATLDEATGRFSVIGSYSKPYDSVHGMLEDYYSSLQATELHASLHQSLAAAAKGALKKARSRVAAFEQQLAAAEGASAVQRRADIIMANVYRIEAGASVLEAEDWDSGEALTVPLDPRLGAVEQAEAMYKRARKLRRAVGAVGPLLEAARSEAEYLEQVESEVAQLADYEAPEDLAALREAASKGRKAAKRQHKGGGGAADAAAAAAGGGQGFRRFASPGGYRILVGRNNKQNDVLSTQVANPWDLWLHVRGMPGSHAVLRIDKGSGAPGDGDVRCAAELAAWFSKARDSGKADVIVTRAEHVRKFKGAKPGQVLLAKEERVLVVRPQDSLAAAAAAAAAAGGGGGREE
ncbi:MAG: fibronectin-binding protein A N-terminus-domain-containing protein [Monoraphidium minutum]|nr:MAG: fibronectin-binding protein A N-terminus-domain-containing protein [Monoraphidium minutum]